MADKLHNSVGKAVEQLNVLALCAQRSSMLLIRSMLGMCGVNSAVGFEHPVKALNHLMSYSIDLVVAEAECKPISGLKFLRILRHQSTDPLCFIPAIITCGNPTSQLVGRAVRSGAHLVLNRPFSTAMLRERLKWIVQDKRPLYLEGHQWMPAKLEASSANMLQGNLPSLITQLGLSSGGEDKAAAREFIEKVLGAEQRRAQAAVLLDRNSNVGFKVR